VQDRGLDIDDNHNSKVNQQGETLKPIRVGGYCHIQSAARTATDSTAQLRQRSTTPALRQRLGQNN
jgi:hypothetical protein